MRPEGSSKWPKDEENRFEDVRQLLLVEISLLVPSRPVAALSRIGLGWSCTSYEWRVGCAPWRELAVGETTGEPL